MHFVGKLNKEIFRCISEDIRTDEVIITEERIQHVNDRHPGEHEKIKEYLPNCKTALLCDEQAYPDLADKVKQAKQFGKISSFFYSSVTANYLAAALDAL
mgnify:CR=1 FL=1